MISIRNATNKDSLTIAQIYNQYVDLENFTMEFSYWDPARVRGMIHNLDRRELLLIAELSPSDQMPENGQASSSLKDRPQKPNQSDCKEMASSRINHLDRQKVERYVAGWASLKRYSNREGYKSTAETSVYIDLESRGFGLGRRLMSELEVRAIRFGFHHLVAKIFTENSHSVIFHQQLGFELVGIQKEVGYTHGRWKDVTILQKLLPENGEN